MTSLVFGVIGGIIGAYVGGPVGAQVGFAIGSGIGGYIDTVNTKINNTGPRLADRSIQVSEEGVSVAVLKGTMRFSGIVVFSTDLIETESVQTTGGKGQPQVTNNSFTYSASFLVMMCEGPCDGVLQIYLDNNLVYSIGPGASAATIIASASFADSVIFYPGNETQMPDPTIESIVGAGNCPAYRGMCCLMFNNMQLANYGNRIPQVSAVISRTTTKTVTHADICALTDNDPGDVLIRGRSWITERKIYLWRQPADDVTTAVEMFESVDGQEQIYLGRVALPILDSSGLAFPVNTRDEFVMEAIEVTVDLHQQLTLMFPFSTAGGDDGMLVRAIPWPVLRTSSYLSMAHPDRMTALDQDSDVVAYAIRDTNQGYFAERVTIFNGASVFSYLIRTVMSSGPPVICALAAAAGRVYALVYDGANMNLHVIDQADGSSIAIYAGPAAIPAVGTDILDSLRTDGSSAWAWVANSTVIKWNADGTYAVLTTVATMQNEGGGAGPPLGGQQCFIADDHMIMQGEGFLNSDSSHPIFLHQLVHWNALSSGDVDLADIVQEECDLAGVTCDVTSLAGKVVHGTLLTKQSPYRTGLEFWASIFRFDAVEDEGVLVFVARGGDPVRTLTVDDLGAYEFGSEPVDPIQCERTQEIDLPASASLIFTNLQNAYQQGSLKTARLNTVSEQIATLDTTALASTPDEAAKYLEIAVLEAWVNRSVYSWSTTYAHMDLKPTDVVILDRGDLQVRVRITKKTDTGAILQWSGVADDPLIVDSAATSSSAVIVNPDITVAGAAMLIPLDIPILRNQDDNAGWYAVAAPMSVSFKGAVIDQIDGGSVTALGSVSNKATTGGCLTALADYSGIGSFDEANTVDVFIRAGMTLSSYTRAETIAGKGAYLIGNEIVFARTATLIGTGKYRLSGLLRYQRGTDGVTHSAGELFVVLGMAGTIRVVNDVGVTHQYAAVSVGRTVDSASRVSFTNTAKGLQTFRTVQRGYGETADGGLLFKWRRRTRRFFPMWQQAPLGEDVEAYLIDFASDGTFSDGFTLTSSQPSLQITAAQRLTLPSPFKWRPRQVASGVGSAPPLTTPTTTIPGGSGPADTLPNTLFVLDPVAIGDGGTIVDSSGSPSTVSNGGAIVRTSQLYFNGDVSLSSIDDAKFNLGSLDFSFSFPVQSNQVPTDGGAGSAPRYLFSHGTADDSLTVLLNIGVKPPGSRVGDTRPTARVEVYLGGFSRPDQGALLVSQFGMNDGTLRAFRFARSSNTWYLIVDGVVVDQFAHTVTLDALTAAPLILGNSVRPSGFDGFKGSMGKFTLKTS